MSVCAWISISVLLAFLGARPAAAECEREKAVAFVDVPPYHYAYDSLKRLRDQGIIRGTQSTEEDLIRNSVFQLYDGYVHRNTDWVSLFILNQPTDWRHAFEKVTLLRFFNMQFNIGKSGDARKVSYRSEVIFIIKDSSSVRTLRSNMAVSVRKVCGIWKIDYGTLGPQREIFF